jgi:hypothetical protein
VNEKENINIERGIIGKIRAQGGQTLDSNFIVPIIKVQPKIE